MVVILNSAILNLAILDSAMIVFPLKVTHTFQDWFPPFAQKIFQSISLTQLDDSNRIQDGCHHQVESEWMSEVFFMQIVGTNSAMLDSDTAILYSDTLLSSLRLTQKHSQSTVTLTQAIPIWLKLIHSDLTWWWKPSWLWPFWIQSS